MWAKNWYKAGGEFNGVSAVYWNSLLRSVGGGMLGIFIPAYIFLLAQAEFGDWKAGVVGMMGYVVAQRIVVMLGSFKAGKLIEKWGFRRSVLVATVLDITLYGLLVAAPRGWWMVVVAGAISGLAIMFYWLPRMAMIAGDGTKEAFGHQVSFLMLIERGAGILGPFVGGVIITQAGFGPLFFLAMALVLASSVPLFFMAHHRHSDGISWGNFVEFVKEKEHRGDMASFVGRGIDDLVMTWMWPLYMFLVIKDFEQMGGVVTITSVVALVATFVAGRVFDRLRARGGVVDEWVFWLAGAGSAVLKLVRSLVTTAGGVLAVDGTDGLISPFYWVPFDSYLYTAAKRFSPVSYFVFREVIYSMGRLVGAGLVIMMLGWPGTWQWIFGLGALGLVMSLKMSKESNR